VKVSCDHVRDELGELAEGLRLRMTPEARRHLRGCGACARFSAQLRRTNSALAALLLPGLASAAELLAGPGASARPARLLASRDASARAPAPAGMRKPARERGSASGAPYCPSENSASRSWRE
jgi:hypothetical protein